MGRRPGRPSSSLGALGSSGSRGSSPRPGPRAGRGVGNRIAWDRVRTSLDLGFAMRPSIIVSVSALAAVSAAAAVVWPGLSLLPRAALLPACLTLLPTLAVPALAVYAMCAILLTSGDLIAAALRLRRKLARIPADRGPAQAAWTALFGRTRFQRLIPPPAAAPWPTAVEGTVVLQARFDPREARREVARLYYIGAARAHFFSALIVMAAGVVLGAAQHYGPLPSALGPVPTETAALAVAGSVLLAILARIAVDVAVEPLIATIARLPAEPVEAGLLLQIVERLADTAVAHPLRDAPVPATEPQLSGQLAGILEVGHRALSEAIERLSATTDGLATTTKSSIEALEVAFRATELREQTAVQNAAPDGAAIGELRDAVVALTAILQQVRERPAACERDIEPSLTAAGGREPDLAAELRKLLQEIEATP
jgi:hypothetical protein